MAAAADGENVFRLRGSNRYTFFRRQRIPQFFWACLGLIAANAPGGPHRPTTFAVFLYSSGAIRHCDFSTPPSLSLLLKKAKGDIFHLRHCLLPYLYLYY